MSDKPLHPLHVHPMGLVQLFGGPCDGDSFLFRSDAQMIRRPLSDPPRTAEYYRFAIGRYRHVRTTSVSLWLGD
jgi:hypothetical protein